MSQNRLMVRRKFRPNDRSMLAALAALLRARPPEVGKYEETPACVVGAQGEGQKQETDSDESYST